MLGDFGITLHTEERKRSKVSVGGGHTRYLAPEVVQLGANYSGKEAAQADIYSLGMVFKDVNKHISRAEQVEELVFPSFFVCRYQNGRRI